ncbi:Uma2 family endonuclease [Nonomuraea diastatica]|uniref:Uma2 family endonuclease n=1 Tax=Nonomuraea diastatica TaxID=1848329 RepID=A0A4R4X5T9_9ACTN|nr:Uma2 family endonuclease [Nonomuraea diastatica]TDD25728.1 Uma2 family endonuclease [Nonomuraea diastatica]
MATIEPKSETAADEPTTGRTVLPGAPPFTVDDLLKFPDDGNRYELCNGSLLVSPAPKKLHQLALYQLQRILDEAAPPELVLLSTVNLRVSAHDLYIPDFVVATEESLHTDELMFSPEELLLAVEVGSPSTSIRDEGFKALAYAKAGIPAYWRIDLEEEPVLYVYELDDDRYDAPAVHKAGAVAHLTTPFPVGFDPAVLIRGRR